MAVDFTAITSQRKRDIRSEMLRRFKQKMRKKGASRAGGGDPKLAGGTGSMKGFEWQSPLERQYVKSLRATQKKKGTIGGRSRSDIASTARATGAGNPNLVQGMKMKSVSKGGTVGKGTHKTGQARTDARAWKKKHMDAAGTDKVKRSKIRKRFKRMVGG